MTLPKGHFKRTHRAAFILVKGGPRDKRNCCQLLVVKQALGISWIEAFSVMSMLGWNAKNAPNVYNMLLEEDGWIRHPIAKSQQWQFQNCCAPKAVLGGTDGYDDHVAFVKDGKLHDIHHSGAFIVDEIWLPGSNS